MKYFYKIILVGFFLVFNHEIQAQISVFGQVMDQSTLEPLPYAAVFEGQTGKAVYADETGYFKLDLSKDPSMVFVSYTGYLTDSLLITTTNSNQAVEFLLLPSATLPTIEVHAPSSLYGNSSSILTPKVSTLARTPSMLGETDLLKSLSLLPGISSGIEGTAGIQIRGGNSNQTHLLIDGISLYNVNHIGGFLSAVPDFGVKGITVYKGGVPPQFGGRLSGVLDVLLKEGRRDHPNYQYTIGVGTLQLGAEGPAGEKGSFLLNARGGWPTVVINLASSGNYKKAVEGSHRSFGLYDFIGKYVYHGQRTKLSFTTFVSGDDGFVQDDLENGLFLDEFKWNNLASAIKVRHLINSKSIIKASVQRAVYDYSFAALTRFSNEQGVFVNFKENRIKLKDWSVDVDYNHSFSNTLNLAVGAKTTFHDFDTEITEGFVAPAADTIRYRSIQQSAWESGVYIEMNYHSPHDRLQLMGGARVSSLFGENVDFYNLEPRLRASLRLHKRLFLNAGYDRHTQYLHQITTDIALFPNDIWLLADALNKPEKSEQLYVGLGGNIGKGEETQWSVEVYTKQMDHLLRVLPGLESSLTLSDDFNDNIARNGQGNSQGIEFFLNKKEGDFQYWLAYTLSFSDRRYIQVNDGLWFPFTFDRQHDISFQASYQINKKWLISTNFVYQTGHSFTAPLTTTAQFNVYTDFNNARYPAFHRLNLGATKRWSAKKKPWQQRQLTFSLYNAYNRANPFSIEINPVRTYRDGVNSSNYILQLKVFTRSLFPLLPGVSYKVDFGTKPKNRT